MSVDSLPMMVLAGGLGTRIKPVIKSTPKCLAPINQKTFLEIILNHWVQQGITRFIFLLGYGADKVENSLKLNKSLSSLSEGFSYIK
tara:strand:- start:228 stop:488 length:261 start_codon:yes stop_codon:yes gene_type:complete